LSNLYEEEDKKKKSEAQKRMGDRLGTQDVEKRPIS
jgi:hypothetical protein